jgi:hypothetical protein
MAILRACPLDRDDAKLRQIRITRKGSTWKSCSRREA